MEAKKKKKVEAFKLIQKLEPATSFFQLLKTFWFVLEEKKC